MKTIRTILYYLEYREDLLTQNKVSVFHKNLEHHKNRIVFPEFLEDLKSQLCTAYVVGDVGENHIKSVLILRICIKSV